MWPKLDLIRIQKCVENKAELDKIFPGLILKIKKNVDVRLGAKYPAKTSWFGPDCRPAMMESQPELEEPINLDWTCFGFEGLPIRECHVGLLFDLHSWPIMYHVGVHAYDRIWKPLDTALKAVRKDISEEYAYKYQEDVTEHQLNDMQHIFDFTQIDSEIEKICSRLEELYVKFQPVFKKELRR